MVNHKTVTSKIYKTKTFIPLEEQYRHENFCEPIIDETTWKQVQFLLVERAKINPRSQNAPTAVPDLLPEPENGKAKNTLNTLATAHTATASNTVLRTQSVKISLTL